jgi:CheY-like chemotaxis protein
MNHRILIIEDSLTQATSTMLQLKQHGFTVAIAPDGHKGIQQARTWQPHAIILDIELPELDGYNVCQKLKQDASTHHIPVIMLTQHTSPTNAHQSIQHGAIDHIPKDTFARQNLLETLRQLGLFQPIDEPEP